MSKLFNGAIGAIDIISESFKYLFCFVAEKLDKDVIFVFEIKIDCSISNLRLFGDL